MKVNMKEYAAELYIRNLQKKVFKGLYQQQQIGVHQIELSRLYSIFQGWKCYAKENALLKKYLNEADDTFARAEAEEFSDLSSPGRYSNMTSQSHKSPENLVTLEDIGLGSTSKFVSLSRLDREERKYFE